MVLQSLYCLTKRLVFSVAINPLKQFSRGVSNKETLKIEIVNIVISAFLKKKPFFNNHSISVPTIRTEWQASHILCKKAAAGKGFQALFSQPLIVAFNESIIHSISINNASNGVSLSQVDSLSDKRSFYFEQF